MKREETIITGRVYHIYKETYDHMFVCGIKGYANYLLNLLKYYKSEHSNRRFSDFFDLKGRLRASLQKELTSRNSQRVTVFAYCLLPQTIHFIVRQEKEGGLVKWLSNAINSLTRYYNISERREFGPLYLPLYKNVHLRTREQCIQTVHYVHSLPLRTGLVHSFESLEMYPWNSYTAYINRNRDRFIDTRYIKKLIGKSDYKNELEAFATVRRPLILVKDN